MKKIGIVNFNSASFTQKMLDYKDLKTIELQIEIKGVSCLGLSLKELFEKVNLEKEIPKTSLPSTGKYIEAYEEMLKKYEDILVLTPDKNLSGTHQGSIVARDMLDEELRTRIHIVETRSFALSEAIICDDAIDMIEKDLNLNTIISKLDEKAQKITTYIVPGSLDYLKLSGRVNMTQALVGKLMVLKLLIKHSNGEANVFKKARGNKKLFQEIKEILNDETIDDIYTAEIDASEELINNMENVIPNKTKTIVSSIIMAAHFGGNTCGFAIISK